jgi:cell division ATPase FtsA
LFDSAFVVQNNDISIINRSAIVYELDDFRRLADPIGYSSEILKGKLSFVLCNNYFVETIMPILKSTGIEKVEFVSTALAEALYLIDPEVRDRIAMILDVGYISTTFSIIQGDGILFQKSFPYGGGFITGYLTEFFDLNFDVAGKLKRKVNLSSFSSSGAYDLIDLDDGKYFSAEEAKGVILKSLDILCENVSNALENSKYVVPDYVPIMLTGGGIAYLRGAKEYVSNRLGVDVRVLSPSVPLMTKPTESAILSLMDLALEQ